MIKLLICNSRFFSLPYLHLTHSADAFIQSDLQMMPDTTEAGIKGLAEERNSLSMMGFELTTF